jgi:hypothetical protein
MEAGMPTAFDSFELTISSWFSTFFEGNSLVAYLGYRKQLESALSDRSVWRKVRDAVLKRFDVRIKLDLQEFLEGVLGKRQDPAADVGKRTFGEEVKDALEKEENKNRSKRLTETLKKQGKLFSSVGSLAGEDLKRRDGEMIAVFGQLVHSSAHFDVQVARQLGKFDGWMLTDEPPDSFESDSNVMKKILLLRADPPFESFFGGELPFDREIAWYPYVQVTGFIDATRIGSENFPSIAAAIVHYRRPEVLKGKRPELLDQAKKVLGIDESTLDSEKYKAAFGKGRERIGDEAERKDKLHCNESEAILFGYLAPIIFKRSKIAPAEADKELAAELVKYRRIRGQALSTNLEHFYSALSGQSKPSGTPL